MNLIEQLVSKVFVTRNNAHLNHWNTSSYAQHMALGSFYEDVITTIDKLVEVYQANFGKIGYVSGSFQSPQEMISALTADAEWIAQNRKDIAQGLTPIENLIDELLEIYLQTLYKLQNLS